MSLRFVDIIQKKRDGGALSEGEISQMVSDYVSGEIPDYQMSAMLMAIFFRGMSDDEVTALTIAMRDSGECVDLSPIQGTKVDKHSTGGVGDKTTLIVGPIAAACGIPIAKMSGRGLGFTGGTYDKLESIPGYRVNLSEKEFFDAVNTHGISLIGQSGELAPADKLLYALRDVTGTVESIPLIASSIMSKKLAAGADKILLDVTVGNGAFMDNIDDAIMLANKMVAIGKGAGRETVAMLTDMNEPLGKAIGNNLEVIEAIEVLSGGGTDALIEVCISLAGMMIALGIGVDYDEGRRIALEKINDGSAYEKLIELVKNQGGDTSYIKNPDKFEKAKKSAVLTSDKAGYISQIDTKGFGIAAGLLGAGRAKKEDAIDYSAGIIMEKKHGDYVNKGDVIATLYATVDERLYNSREFLQDKIIISDAPPTPLSAVYEIIR